MREFHQSALLMRYQVPGLAGIRGAVREGPVPPCGAFDFSGLILGFVATRFPARVAVVLPVFRQAQREVCLAKCAILDTCAAFLGLIANPTTKFLRRHSERPSLRIKPLPDYSAAESGQKQSALVPWQCATSALPRAPALTGLQGLC